MHNKQEINTLFFNNFTNNMDKTINYVNTPNKVYK